MSRKDRTRPVSRDDTFKKLRALRCFNEVYERIIQGWAPSELARFIQMDRSEYQDVSQVSLMQTIERFRKTIPPAVLVNKRMPKAMERAIEEVEDGLDELKELTALYRLHMERVHMDHAIEKRMNKSLNTMTNEIRVAKELLTAIADLKMDLGLNTRHLGQVDAEVTVEANENSVFGKASIQEVVSDPEKRRKVLNIAERILQLPARTAKARAEAPPEEQITDEELELIGVDGLPDPDAVDEAVGVTK